MTCMYIYICSKHMYMYMYVQLLGLGMWVCAWLYINVLVYCIHVLRKIRSGYWP